MDTTLLITEYSEGDQVGAKTLILRVLKEFGFEYNANLTSIIKVL